MLYTIIDILRVCMRNIPQMFPLNPVPSIPQNLLYCLPTLCHTALLRVYIDGTWSVLSDIAKDCARNRKVYDQTYYVSH